MSASKAAPRAPAASPTGITWIGIFACSPAPPAALACPNGFPRETSAEIPDWFQAHRLPRSSHLGRMYSQFRRKKSPGVSLNPNPPDNPTLHYHLGMAYAKTGQATLAREQLQQRLKLNPNSSDAEEAKSSLRIEILIFRRSTDPRFLSVLLLKFVVANSRSPQFVRIRLSACCSRWASPSSGSLFPPLPAGS